VSALLEPQAGRIPTGTSTALSGPFWEGCRRRELLYQYFPQSGRAQFNPAPVDRVSLSSSFEWRRSAGLGSVYSWSAVFRPPSQAFSVPYVAAIITLGEGFEMVSNIVGCRPEDVYIGQPVRVVFHAVNEDLTLPYFTPLSPAAGRSDAL